LPRHAGIISLLAQQVICRAAHVLQYTLAEALNLTYLRPKDARPLGVGNWLWFFDSAFVAWRIAFA
jgi:hypothetical protein